MVDQNTAEKKKSKEEKTAGKRVGVVENRYGAESAQKIRERAKRISLFAAFFISSWMIASSEGLFSTYPFGIALISAAWGHYLPIGAGVLLSYIFSDMESGYLFAYLTVAAIRIVMAFSPMPIAERSLRVADENRYEKREAIEDGKKEKRGFIFSIMSAYNISFDSRDGYGKEVSRQNDIFSILFAAVGGFVGGLFDLISNDFSFYSLYGCLFMTLFCPIIAYLISGGMRAAENTSNLRLNIGVGTLATLFLLSADEKMFFGMMLSPIVAMALLLFAADRKGIAYSLTAAVVIGLAFSLPYMPLFLICAIIYCVLVKIKRGAAIAGVCGAVVLYSYYLASVDGIVSILTPMLLGIPIFLVVERIVSFIDPKSKKEVSANNSYFTEAVIEKDKNIAVRSKIHALSDAFSSLSKTFYELSDIFHRPDALHLRDITDEAFSSVCAGCRNHDVCYGSHYNRILDANAKITSALHTKGYVAREDIEPSPTWCIRCDRIILRVNDLCSKYTEELIKNQNVDAFASNYEEVNAVLLDAISSDDGEYECDTAAGEKIFEYLSSLGFELRGVVACGKRCKRVTVRGICMNEKVNGERADSIVGTVSKIMGEPMSGPTFEVSNDGTDMIFVSKPKYSVVCSHARRAAFEGLVVSADSGVEAVNPFEESEKEKRDELCGDVTGAFITKNSYFYSMICDGMGSGRDAALCAGICASFAEKMLFAGNRADITLRMLNNFLRGENLDNSKECSVAVDLFELDLMRGVASFIKSGAVPTYVLRGGKVYRVSSRTMPIGIIKMPDIKISKLDMEKGDIVVMMSDGCIQDDGDCIWLTRLLCELKTNDDSEAFADEIRDKVMYAAKAEAQAKNINDDISVSVIIVV